MKCPLRVSKKERREGHPGSSVQHMTPSILAVSGHSVEIWRARSKFAGFGQKTKLTRLEQKEQQKKGKTTKMSKKKGSEGKKLWC